MLMGYVEGGGEGGRGRQFHVEGVGGDVLAPLNREALRELSFEKNSMSTGMP